MKEAGLRSAVEEFRQAWLYWTREVLRGTRYRRQLRARGIDISSVPLWRLGLDRDKAHNYANSGGPDLEVVLDTLGITADHSILDLGCGKGGALLTMAMYPFRRIAGLDLCPDMLDVARKNMAKAGVSHVEFICADATTFGDYDDFTHLYMYNPFPAQVLRAVMGNVAASLERRPRPLTVIYKNPRFHEEIVRDGLFVLERQFTHSGHPFYVYKTAQRRA